MSNEKKEIKKEKPISFKLIDTEEKPVRHYRKGSKFDPIVESFTKSLKPIQKLEVEGKTANYIRTQLKKRIDAGKLPITVSVVNDVVYLEQELKIGKKKEPNK